MILFDTRQTRLLLLALCISLLIHGLVLAGGHLQRPLAVAPILLHAELRKVAVSAVEVPPSVTRTAAPEPTPTPQRPSRQRTQASPEQPTAPASAAEHADTKPAIVSSLHSELSSSPLTQSYTPPVHNAAYLNNPRPAYPLAARRRGLEGTVRIEVLVGSDGLTRETRLKTTAGASDLDDAALTAVRRWRFVPARRGSEAVEGWITVPIRFQLEDSI